MIPKAVWLSANSRSTETVCVYNTPNAQNELARIDHRMSSGRYVP